MLLSRDTSATQPNTTMRTNKISHCGTIITDLLRFNGDDSIHHATKKRGGSLLRGTRYEPRRSIHVINNAKCNDENEEVKCKAMRKGTRNFESAGLQATPKLCYSLYVASKLEQPPNSQARLKTRATSQLPSSSARRLLQSIASHCHNCITAGGRLRDAC